MIARARVIALALAVLGQAAHAAGGDDAAERRLAEQEGLVETRERRVKSLTDQLEATDAATRAEAARIEDLEKTDAAYEKGLDAREQWIIMKGLSSSETRPLEVREAQLSGQERTLAAQERAVGPVVDAATGREKDAARREEAERQEVSRLTEKVAAGGGQDLELRGQLLSARNRQLTAAEAKLQARGERLAALERQLRLKSDRVDAWSRLLDTRAERLQLLLDRRASPPQAAAKAEGAASASKVIYVIVVKSPTSIVRERGDAASSGPAPALGTAPEKVVAAATMVAFASPTATVPELDGEAIDRVARVAAKEGCDVLIWARARDQSFMAEAQRRADDIKVRVLAIGPVAERRTVTRVTSRPGTQRVDVVVSALKDAASPSGAAAGGGAPPLEFGEGGKRQIREAVQAASPLLEGCVGTFMQAGRMKRAEGTLKLTVSSQGKVQTVRAGGTDLGSEALDACLATSAPKWQLPSSDGGYFVEVPITVVQGGAR